MKSTYCTDCGVLIEIKPTDSKKEIKAYSLCDRCQKVRNGGTVFTIRDLGVI
jgi:transcription initiation factor TFIIIB Brf1 subunit/transcription initiation factor TFIIB